MKTSNKILIGFFLFIFLGGLSIMTYMKANTHEVTPIDPVGEVRTENVNIPSLKNLDVGVGTIYLSKGDPKIEITCAENIHQLLEKGYDNGTFFIRKKEGVFNRMGVVIHVFSNDLENIIIRSRGELKSEEPFQSEQLSIEANNRSKVDMMLEVNNLTLKASNDSKMTLDGTANTLNANSSNSARIRAKNLKANEVDASVSNSARLDVQAIKKLKVSVSQAASVRYYGTPERLEPNVSQAGQLKKIDLNQ